tara:strand:+ start:18952 stop:19590 length:639 start_codon:yes stop_codon:yes gene_type:complete
MKLAVNIKTNNSNNSKRVPCPEGVHSGVCVDVEDMGWIKSNYGWKGYIKMYFEAMVEDDDGNTKAMLVKTKRLNAVISGGSRRSNLFSLLEGWIGDGFTSDEDFDFTTLIGKSATLVVEENSFINDNNEEIQYSLVDVVKKNKRAVEPSGEWTVLTERDGYEPPEYTAFGEGPQEAQDERQAKRDKAKADREAKSVNEEPAKKEADGDEVPF